MLVKTFVTVFFQIYLAEARKSLVMSAKLPSNAALQVPIVNRRIRSACAKKSLRRRTISTNVDMVSLNVEISKESNFMSTFLLTSFSIIEYFSNLI